VPTDRFRVRPLSRITIWHTYSRLWRLKRNRQIYAWTRWFTGYGTTRTGRNTKETERIGHQTRSRPRRGRNAARQTAEHGGGFAVRADPVFVMHVRNGVFDFKPRTFHASCHSTGENTKLVAATTIANRTMSTDFSIRSRVTFGADAIISVKVEFRRLETVPVYRFVGINNDSHLIYVRTSLSFFFPPGRSCPSCEMWNANRNKVKFFSPVIAARIVAQHSVDAPPTAIKRHVFKIFFHRKRRRQYYNVRSAEVLHTLPAVRLYRTKYSVIDITEYRLLTRSWTVGYGSSIKIWRQGSLSNITANSI